MNPKIFPTILIVLDICAAVSYGIAKEPDWRKVVYWISAAVLTATVTY